MADKVFVNGRSAVHAGSSGKSMCFPDVNLCPPTPPAGPIPLPLPNMAQAMDMQGGASSVTIADNPMGKKSSFFAKSTGNESAQSTGGGVVSHVVQGKAYFTSFSMDVTIEGEPAVRHLDMMTHNHAAQTPPNAAMGTYLAMMDPAMVGSATVEQPERKEEKGKLPAIEICLDHANGAPAEGIDAMLVSDDGKYNQTMSLKAATPKGGLLCLRFEKVPPKQTYSLYWKIGKEQVPFFEHVPFSVIAEHTPGSERPPPAAPENQAASEPDDDENGEPEDDEKGPADPPPEYPEEWFVPSAWNRK
jgi:hypothetical protein